jgi:hypothetical protein
MNVEILVQWLRRLDHRTIRVGDTWWYSAGPRAYQALPYHTLIHPSEQELRAVFRQTGAVSLRYFSPFQRAQGVVSYHVVFDEGTYDFSALSGNARSKVRRGLKQCEVMPISFERLAEDGWRLQHDTLKRQGRAATMHAERWRQLCLAARDLPGFEAWGALIDNMLVASMLLVRIDDTYCVLYAQSDSQYLDRYINNALCYTVSHELRSRPGIRQIFYSTQSLDAPASVDEFKFRMGYKARPVRQCAVFHPLAAPLVNHTTHRVVQSLLHRYPQSSLFPKMEGMLRLYLESQLPVVEQQWPECLAEHKPEILNA